MNKFSHTTASNALADADLAIGYLPGKARPSGTLQPCHIRQIGLCRRQVQLQPAAKTERCMERAKYIRQKLEIKGSTICLVVRTWFFGLRGLMIAMQIDVMCGAGALCAFHLRHTKLPVPIVHCEEMEKSD